MNRAGHKENKRVFSYHKPHDTTGTTHTTHHTHTHPLLYIYATGKIGWFPFSFVEFVDELNKLPARIEKEEEEQERALSCARCEHRTAT